jgi:hypothetical protein
MRDRSPLPGPLRALVAALGALVLTAGGVASTFACSPLFEEPTIADLGPDAVVVVGSIGEQVEGGRLFHVERVFSGGVTATPMVIAFKEGQAIGDCSYPVSQGARLLIATVRDPDGRVPVDLVTLQADPATPDGLRYLAEATALFGPGTVPAPKVVPLPTPAPAPLPTPASASLPTAAPSQGLPMPLIMWLAIIALSIVGGLFLWRQSRQRSRRTP